MNWAVLASFTLVLLVMYVPFLQPFFDTVPLTLDDWLFMLPFFFASPIAMELVKLYFRRRTRQRGDGGGLACRRTEGSSVMLIG